MTKSKVDTDKVLVNIKKTLYDFRDLDFAAMSKEEQTSFQDDLAACKDIALAIKEKIKDK